jgi:STE24 endopeptidase
MTPDPIFLNEDKATRYHRLRRRASFLGTALTAVWLLGLLVTGGSASLRDVSVELARQSFVLTVACYVILVGLLSEAIQLPLSFYQGVVLERRYGLSTQSTWRWSLDQLKAGALALAFAVVGALIVWSLLRWTPQWWWLAAALCFASLMVVLAQLAPVVTGPARRMRH